MIREILRPDTNSLIVSIPNKYINKDIELILFPLNPNNKVKTKHKINKSKKLTNSLFGALKNSNIDQNDYNIYLENKYI